MKVDINLGEDPDLPIEGRYTLENTNDMGEPLIPQTTQVIIAEFRKFIFLVIAKIMRQKRTGKIQMDKEP